MADRILAALEPPFAAFGEEFTLGASVGVAIYPHDGEYGPELLRRADAALYHAKRAGRRRFELYSPAHDPLTGRLTLATRLRRALARGEFLLHYQPVFDLRSGAPVAVEALLRWLDPERGMIAPGEFIPFAEESGLIAPIGDWIVDEVCRQAAAWRDGGVAPIVSFNVSALQLRGDFVDTVASALQRHGADPHALVVEVTESAAMDDPGDSVRTLAALRSLGLALAIDDFGAGLSSLGRLGELDVDFLKLDRSLLRDVPASRAQSALLSAVLPMARALGMEPVVEGVERREQLDHLAAEGFRLAQGFHLGRPMPAAEVAPLFAAGADAAARAGVSAAKERSRRLAATRLAS